MGQAQELQTAFKRREAARARADELSLVASTKTPGVDAVPEAWSAEQRAEFLAAIDEEAEALRDVKTLVQALYPQKARVGSEE